MPTSAARLGWDADWQRTLDDLDVADGPGAHGDPAADPAGLVGRVCRVDRGACDVLLPGDPDVTTVTARWSTTVTRAATEDPSATPATGDWVLLVPYHGESAAAAWSVARLLPRRTSVQRLGVSGSSHAQVLAANADVVAVVQAMVPDFDLGRIERLLALAWSSGARPVVVLTKADLHPDPARAVLEVAASAAGCDLLPVSAPLDAGLDPLRALLRDGATVALLGASGVGKSTLVNALLGTQTMATRELGVEGKGRHTTVTRELHLVPGGGAVLDTPGLRAVGLHGDEDLGEAFADVLGLAAGCRFGDCSHTVEPGCAVLAAVADGSLPERRLESWRGLQREAAFQARRTDARLREQWTNELKARTRSYRARPDKNR